MWAIWKFDRRINLTRLIDVGGRYNQKDYTRRPVAKKNFVFLSIDTNIPRTFAAPTTGRAIPSFFKTPTHTYILDIAFELFRRRRQTKLSKFIFLIFIVVVKLDFSAYVRGWVVFAVPLRRRETNGFHKRFNRRCRDFFLFLSNFQKKTEFRTRNNTGIHFSSNLIID